MTCKVDFNDSLEARRKTKRNRFSVAESPEIRGKRQLPILFAGALFGENIRNRISQLAVEFHAVQTADLIVRATDPQVNVLASLILRVKGNLKGKIKNPFADFIPVMVNAEK